MQPSKTTKRITKAILFAAIFLLLMTVFNAAFELDETRTEEMLASYSKTEDFETVFVGNSAGEMLDASVYTKLSGEPSFNMCTPSQGLSVSLKNIKLASSHHDIKKAVLLMTPDIVNSESYDAIDHLYDRTIDSSSPFFVRIKKSAVRNADSIITNKTAGSERSLNIWIPWENETIHGFPNVSGNLKRRFNRLITGRPLGCDIAYDLNTKKFERLETLPTAEDETMLDEDIKLLDELSLPEGTVAADKLSILSDMCRFCRDNGIELLIIVTPHRTDYYGRYEGFRENAAIASAYLHDLISKRGFMYYNTEDDAQLHEILPDEYFYDWEHITGDYEDKATAYLYDVIKSLSKEWQHMPQRR